MALKGKKLTCIFDGLASEREQVQQQMFYIDTLILEEAVLSLDAPGHIEYTKNMVTAASNANVALFAN